MNETDTIPTFKRIIVTYSKYCADDVGFPVIQNLVGTKDTQKKFKKCMVPYNLQMDAITLLV